MTEHKQYPFQCLLCIGEFMAFYTYVIFDGDEQQPAKKPKRI